jgi:hypothetical protein
MPVALKFFCHCNYKKMLNILCSFMSVKCRFMKIMAAYQILNDLGKERNL